MTSFIDLVDKKKVIFSILRILDRHINSSSEYPTELFEIRDELLTSIKNEQSFFATENKHLNK